MIKLKKKTLSKLGTERNFSSLIKSSQDKPTTNTVLDHKRLNVSPLRLGNRRPAYLVSLLPFKTVLGVLASARKKQKARILDMK